MRYHTSRLRVAPDLGTFRAGVVRAAGAALTAPNLTEADRQLLADMRRQEGRYAFRALDRLIDLLANVPKESDALAWVDDLRGAILARRRRLFGPEHTAALPEAIEAETLAQAQADPLQMAVALHAPTPEAVRGALALTRLHRAALEQVENVLCTLRFRMAHGGMQ